MTKTIKEFYRSQANHDPIEDKKGGFSYSTTMIEAYARYVLSEHRKAAKYYFEGKVYTEEELRTCGLTMNENNAPVLIKEEIRLPEYKTCHETSDDRYIGYCEGARNTIDEVKRLNGM